MTTVEEGPGVGEGLLEKGISERETQAADKVSQSGSIHGSERRSWVEIVYWGKDLGKELT